MIKPLFPALALLTLSLAACGQQPAAQVPAAPPAAAAPVASAAQAGVKLRIPAPSALSAQYVNPLRTTRVDVQIDGAAATAYTLGSAQAPCAGGLCTIDLGLLSPASHTFGVSTHGVNPDTGQSVMISQGSVTQTLSAGQNTNVSLTLTPVGSALSLSSAVKQYDSAGRAFGNHVRFTVLGGHSLPAYYDIQGTDSVGDALPAVAISAVLCGSGSVAIMNVSGAAHANRFRVEMTGTGPATLSLRAGKSCAGNSVLASQDVSGSADLGALNRRTISGGDDHYSAIRTDHTVVGWGDPVPSGLSTVISLSSNSASDHGMALRDDGSVAYWGYKGNEVTLTPDGLKDVVGLGSGFDHSLALKSDGTVVGWGLNAAAATVPSGLSGVVTTVVGLAHNLALRSDGTVVGWGDNSYGQTSVPAGLADVVAVAAGASFSLALRSDGTVVGWGDNSYGQTSVPAGLADVVAVAAGASFSLALRSDGTVVAWGDDSSGQTKVPAGLGGVIALAGGTSSSVALTRGGSVVTWGARSAPDTVTAPGSVLP